MLIRKGTVLHRLSLPANDRYIIDDDIEATFNGITGEVVIESGKHTGYYIPAMLTPAECATFLGVKKGTFRQQLRRNKSLEPTKRGDNIFVNSLVLASYVPRKPGRPKK